MSSSDIFFERGRVVGSAVGTDLPSSRRKLALVSHSRKSSPFITNRTSSQSSTTVEEINNMRGILWQTERLIIKDAWTDLKKTPYLSKSERTLEHLQRQLQPLRNHIIVKRKITEGTRRQSQATL